MGVEAASRVAELGTRAYASARYRTRWQFRRQVERVAGARWHAPSGEAVALTFDDGPDPRYTESLLGVLGDLGVQATFFCIGDRVRANPELAKAIVSAGHSIGSHSLHHPDTWTVGTRALIHELRAGHDTVEAAIGRPTRLFRPPKGYLDLRVASAIRVAGLRSWLWSVDPADWKVGATADDIVAGCAGAGPTDVVLLHDGIADVPDAARMDRVATLEALPRIVEQVRSRGLEFAALPM